MKKVEALVARLHRKRPEKVYALEAYLFILQGVNHTISKLPKRRHINARELLEGVKSFAWELFGALAGEVLRHWGIRTTQDIGRLVFDLVESKMLSRQEEDRLEDFEGVFDLQETLKTGYRIEVKDAD